KDLSVGVLLEEAGRDRGGDGALDRLGDDPRLALAEGQQHNLPGVENRTDPHGDRPAGDVFLAKEIARRVTPGHAIECDQAGHAFAPRAGFVEPDVTSAADAKDLQVN